MNFKFLLMSMHLDFRRNYTIVLTLEIIKTEINKFICAVSKHNANIAKHTSVKQLKW